MTHTPDTLNQKPKLDAEIIKFILAELQLPKPQYPDPDYDPVRVHAVPQLEALIELAWVLVEGLRNAKEDYKTCSHPHDFFDGVDRALLAAAPIKHLLKGE